jgi:acetate kinase
MLILVINAGSSSIKYRLLDMADEEALSWGVVEKIGEPCSRVLHQGRTPHGVHQITEEHPIRDHREAMERVVRLLTTEGGGVIDDPEHIDAIGHRVVHGGGKISPSGPDRCGCGGRHPGAHPAGAAPQSRAPGGH